MALLHPSALHQVTSLLPGPEGAALVAVYEMPVGCYVHIGNAHAALLTAFGTLQVKKRDGVTGYDWKGFRLLMRHFWHRLVGSAGVWFCNDWVSSQSPCT